MRAYVRVTGILFALLAAAHVWRVAVEGRVLADQPWFVATTIIAGGLAAWAAALVIRSPRR